MRRSLLFIPANNPNMLANAGLLGADSVIFDLEDTVAPQEKDAARILLRNALKYLDFFGTEIIVRINALDTPYWEQDLKAIVPLKPAIIMPPKVSGAQTIQALEQSLNELERDAGIEEDSIHILPLLESALGIENAFLIAQSSARVVGLFLGAEDLSADLHCQRSKAGGEILYARQRMVNAARAAGVEAYDTPFTDINDSTGLRQDALLAKSLGFSGKTMISPRHVSCINEIFSPTDEEIRYALEVFEAIRRAKEQGKGAIALRGKMIDAPIVARAGQVLQAAQDMGWEEDELE